MFKNEFVTKEQIDMKFDERLATLELARIEAMIAEATPTTLPAGPMVGFPGGYDPAQPVENGPSRVAQIEAEINDVRALRAEALKSAAKS